MGKKKATIYDIADRTGASASTVASVLNGSWQERRIAERTAIRIRKIASDLHYSRNLQASGLRRARSGIAGMIIPKHDNRFFSAMSESFETEARARGLTPLIVSTLRDPKEERRTVATLISHNVDQLFITGATAPDPLADMCANAGIPHVNVDLPGKAAPSVISDNYWGACELTRYIVDRIDGLSGAAIHFIGGIGNDHNTRERVRGFLDVCRAKLDTADPERVDTCGYAPEAAEAAIRSLHDRLGGLPAGLFINSTIAFEGVFRFLKTLPAAELNRVVVGCYDWDPFISYLQFPVAMVRQDGAALIANAFRLIEDDEPEATVTLVRPALIVPESVQERR
jgi:LacI family transcriptional regulator, fructose operon transcriptional repressor